MRIENEKISHLDGVFKILILSLISFLIFNFQFLIWTSVDVTFARSCVTAIRKFMINASTESRRASECPRIGHTRMPAPDWR